MNGFCTDAAVPLKRSSKVRAELPDSAREDGIGSDTRGHLPAGVQDGAVIAAAEVGADLLERQSGEVPGQVHTDLSRQQDVAVPATRLQLPRFHTEVAAH